MRVLVVFTVLVTCIRAQYEGCSSSVVSSADILIVNNRFRYLGNVGDLKPLANFVENVKSSGANVQLHFPCYDGVKLRTQMNADLYWRNVTYFTKDLFMDDYISSVIGKLFPQKKRSGKKRPQILILMINSFTSGDMKSIAARLKREGAEVFTVGVGKSSNHELAEIASYPAETHTYSWIKYPDPNKALAELSDSVCLSIEHSQQARKKSLLSQVRLQGSDGSCGGRVEVLYNHTWGWLSDQRWDRSSADVICRQLKCGPSLDALKNDPFGPGTGHILGKGTCRGHEDDFSQCLLGAWNERDTKRNQKSAGVICLPSGLQSVSLVNGPNSCNGTVEVMLNNSPGRICIWDFDLREAAVICKQIGCGPVLKIQENMESLGSGVRMVEKVHCSGEESELSQCSARLWREEPCPFSISAGIVCSTEAPSKVSLVGGSSPCSGKVKINYRDAVGPICADDWGLKEDAVVCRQMGCGPAVEIAEKRVDALPSQTPAVLLSVICSGTETSLSQCSSVSSKGNKCDIPEAEVLCSQSGISNVRLVNGSSPCSGRVEVHYKGKWGTVCDETWDLSDADVVCKELGCGSAIEAPKSAHFSPGSGPVWLEKVFCNGSESNLSQCGAVTSRKGHCDHSQDAGVVCTGEQKTQPLEAAK